MRQVLVIVVAIIWGSLAGQFLVQIVASGIIMIIYLAATIFAKVLKGMNAVGSLVGLGQMFLFSILFFAENWIRKSI
jgi:hypothetical protein